MKCRVHFVLFLLLISHAGFAAGRTDLVVYPFPGTDEGGVNKKTAAILRQKLKEFPALHVIDPRKTDSVLSYHQSMFSGEREPLLKKAAGLLTDAKNHYFHFGYAAARAELETLITLFDQSPHLVREGGEALQDAWITLALVHAAKKEKQEAVHAFQKVLTINPYFQLEEKAFSPSVRRLFQKAKKGENVEQAGEIRIRTDPKVAEIYLNGIYRGVSPLIMKSLPAGPYQLTFKANRYKTVHKDVLLSSGQHLELKPKLYWEYSRAKKQAVLNAARKQIDFGLTIAGLMKADKVVLVEIKGDTLRAQMIDRRYRSAHHPIILNIREGAVGLEEDLDRLVRLLFAQTEINLLKNPAAHLDPEGVGSPILLGKRKRKISKGLVIGGLSAVGVGGLVAGILAASAPEAPNTGGVQLSFK